VHPHLNTEVAAVDLAKMERASPDLERLADAGVPLTELLTGSAS
jgi:hypothetical protein